jgi:restriction system protein
MANSDLFNLQDFMSNNFGFIVVIAAIIFLGTCISFVLEHFKEKKEYEEYQAHLSQSRITDIDRMDGIEFEHYLVVLFKKLGIPAEITAASNDYGADLILEGKERVVVQAKRYSKKVGIKAVQEVNSAKAYYDAKEAWVITNNFFTQQAVKLAESTNVKLIDRDELVDLIIHSNTSNAVR